MQVNLHVIVMRSSNMPILISSIFHGHNITSEFSFSFLIDWMPISVNRRWFHLNMFCGSISIIGLF